MAQIRRDPASEVVSVSPRRDFRPGMGPFIGRILGGARACRAVGLAKAGSRNDHSLFATLAVDATADRLGRPAAEPPTQMYHH
jgi:hypothetical protein